jgi:hypothetical protein
VASCLVTETNYFIFTLPTLEKQTHTAIRRGIRLRIILIIIIRRRVIIVSSVNELIVAQLKIIVFSNVIPTSRGTYWLYLHATIVSPGWKKPVLMQLRGTVGIGAPGPA